MLLDRRSIVFQVCIALLVIRRASSTPEYDYTEEEEDHSAYVDDHSDEKKLYGGKPAASGLVSKKKDPETFTHSPAFVAYLEKEYADYVDPSGKESKKQKSYASSSDEEELDPYEALRKSFQEKQAEAESLHNEHFAALEKADEEAAQSAIPPGPFYSGYKVPYVGEKEDSEEEREQSRDDVESVPPPLKSKKNKRKKVKSSRPEHDDYQDTFNAYGPPKNTEEQIEQTKIDPSTYYGGKHADYDTGKSSSTVSQHPSASHKHSATTQRPYEKYNYEKPTTSIYEAAVQSDYHEAIPDEARTSKNVETEALNDDPRDEESTEQTQNVAESRDKKGCRRIDGPENAEDMECFVCEDAGNKATYTQCSYASSSEPVNQYASSSIKYSVPSKEKAPAHSRHKRSPRRSSGRYSEDPYFEVSERNKKYFEDYEKEQQAAETERQRDFHYKPYIPEEDESYSESQSSELLKTPGACKEVERDGSVCTVCTNPKTGGNFEQCSYSSAPKEQKYAYVAEKKYDSEDEPEETKIVTKQSSEEPQKAAPSNQVLLSAVAPAETASKYSSATKSKIVRDPFPELAAAGTTIDVSSQETPEIDESEEDSGSDEETDSSEEKKERSNSEDEPYYFTNYGELKKDKKLVEDDPYGVPEHFAASINQKKTAGQEEDEDAFDEYHYKIFPELYNDESKNEEQKAQPEGQKQQDVEEVLAEFAKKDRSNCQKAEKNGMTCFLCVDQNKVQHEECMYIAESKPKPTHIAYHEVQRLKDPKGEHNPFNPETHPEESKTVETIQAATQQPLDSVLSQASELSKRKKFFKKVITTPLPLANAELAAAASDVYRTVVPYDSPKEGSSGKTSKVSKDSKASGSAPDSERLEDRTHQEGSKEPETPKEVDVGDEDGAYSAETKPVYSKLYGTVLPKYMVEKTDFEKDFDAASGFD